MGIKVLIVEDEAIVAMEIQESIEHLGYSISGVADTAEKAVELAVSGKPDLILMDVHLKGDMDGVEAADMIRKSVNVPVIFLTAYSGDEVLERAKITEPYGYLLKPVQEEQLASAIRTATHKHKNDSKRQGQIQAFTSVFDAIPSGIVVVDPALKVKYTNGKARELIGAASDELVGRPLGEVVVLEGIELTMDSSVGFDEALSEGKSTNFGEFVLQSSAGVQIPVAVSIVPLKNEQGMILGVLVILSDRRYLKETLSKAKESAQDVDGSGPIIHEQKDLQSYLEVEIVRLAMSEGVEEESLRCFREGQIAAHKKILRLMYGEQALDEIDQILPE